MYATQYEITLPADYDMEIIRRRVASGGAVLDNRAGLGLKAYVIRERGVDGSPVNAYAPFYLWNDPAAMAAFFTGGGGFHNIVRDFGRPPVRQWAGLACAAGPARVVAPRAATRSLTALPREAEGALEERIAAAANGLEALARRPEVHTAALAVDLGRWQLLRFVLWNEAPAPGADAGRTGNDETGEGAGSVERYEVLHLSAPGLSGLPEGRLG
ncbi:DUF4865 family protein [Streptomyces sp. NPDC007088]|uniref:DUF4865 family protein n=1 Tax=Streptomyces sp. NPDC007088 TaxID=3364773 RepID=UPI0036C37875